MQSSNTLGLDVSKPTGNVQGELDHLMDGNGLEPHHPWWLKTLGLSQKNELLLFRKKPFERTFGSKKEGSKNEECNLGEVEGIIPMSLL